jgi:hypothetical protein
VKDQQAAARDFADTLRWRAVATSMTRTSTTLSPYQARNEFVVSLCAYARAQFLARNDTHGDHDAGQCDTRLLCPGSKHVNPSCGTCPCDTRSCTWTLSSAVRAGTFASLQAHNTTMIASLCTISAPLNVVLVQDPLYRDPSCNISRSPAHSVSSATKVRSGVLVIMSAWRMW